MQSWFIILFSISIAFLLKAFINLLFPNKHLPPGPTTFPIVGNLLWLRRSTSQIEPILRNLHAKFGPIVTLHFGSRRAIFVADRSLAYKALVQNGAVFSNRPPAPPTTKLFSSNQHNITSSSYGPTWRLLRRNLNREILHPARVRSYTRARKWVLHILLDRLKSESKSGDPVRVMDHFQYGMFCLLFMCFGDQVNESQIKHVEDLQRRLLLGFNRFNILNLWPRLTKIVLRKRWEELLQLRKYQEEVLIPLIRSRKKEKEESLNEGKEDEYVIAYVDSLLDLELPEEKRKLNESEIVSLSSEFLNAGTDTTSTALQWIMANLVKYPHIQEKIFMEIKGVVEEGEDEVKEDELQKMAYLKAVILEGLRRHPPAHFVLPHAVTEDVEVNGYVIPKDVSINVMVAEMGWDPKVWEDPMAFKPERFVGGDFDITGSREIKMMPFGVGRRICPGLGLAMLHLEYFVANLVWKFEWKGVEGDEIDLSEKQEFTIVMKNPLKVHICERSR
ncbi:cytochrome P450 89A2-like [Pistacia vera]|uniref:cytochrome P450 89A2-like n=1 Tax=Pistacia vera TaxID=55513 RepID=UPI001262E413|nr:cytochrome P450 89A2-like [Pistacia vera]